MQLTHDRVSGVPGPCRLIKDISLGLRTNSSRLLLSQIVRWFTCYSSHLVKMADVEMYSAR